MDVRWNGTGKGLIRFVDRHAASLQAAALLLYQGLHLFPVEVQSILETLPGCAPKTTLQACLRQGEVGIENLNPCRSACNRNGAVFVMMRASHVHVHVHLRGSKPPPLPAPH